MFCQALMLRPGFSVLVHTAQAVLPRLAALSIQNCAAEHGIEAEALSSWEATWEHVRSGELTFLADLLSRG